MKYIPLANLKNTTGIVTFCKDAKEIVIANRNGLPKLVLMSREVYETVWEDLQIAYCFMFTEIWNW